MIVHLPSTAEAIFPRIAKNSKIEGEGWRRVPKRILPSLDVNGPLRLIYQGLNLYSSNWYRTWSIYLFIRNNTLLQERESIVFSWILTGQVKITFEKVRQCMIGSGNDNTTQNYRGWTLWLITPKYFSYLPLLWLMFPLLL